MSASAPARRWLLRGAAVLLAAGGLLACRAPLWLGVPTGTALTFCVTLVLCSSVAMLARGLGPRVGTLLGLCVGLLVVGNLTRGIAAPLGNLAVFGVVATGLIALVGNLAGGWASSPTEDAELTEPRRVAPPAPGHTLASPFAGASEPCRSTGFRAAPRHAGNNGPCAVEGIGGLLADFAEWVQAERRRAGDTQTQPGPAFAQFVRRSLWARFGIADAVVLRLSADGERLEWLGDKDERVGPWPSPRRGLIGAVVKTQRPHVAESCREAGSRQNSPFDGDRPTTDAAPPVLAEAGSDWVPAEDACRWAWLLPLRAEQRVCALVAVRELPPCWVGDVVFAEAVRNQLELLWGHLATAQALARHLRTDGLSGLVNRPELLSQLVEVLRHAEEHGEPLCVLVLAVEGLRWLDDTGRWSLRDALIQRAGEVLRSEARVQDVAGRFDDERFVVVLRGTPRALGEKLAQETLAAVRAVIACAAEPAPCDMFDVLARHGTLCVRAGLAGMDIWATDGSKARHDGGARPALPTGQALLERALGLLEYARDQRIDLATDLMKGLPPRLLSADGEGDDDATWKRARSEPPPGAGPESVPPCDAHSG